MTSRRSVGKDVSDLPVLTWRRIDKNHLTLFHAVGPSWWKLGSDYWVASDKSYGYRTISGLDLYIGKFVKESRRLLDKHDFALAVGYRTGPYPEWYSIGISDGIPSLDAAKTLAHAIEEKTIRSLSLEPKWRTASSKDADLKAHAIRALRELGLIDLKAPYRS